MKVTQRLPMMAVAVAMCLPASVLIAQTENANEPPPPDFGGGFGNGGGFGRHNRENFDPAQMQQRMLANIRKKLAFTNDTEWASVQPLVQKVLDARRDATADTFRMGAGRFGGGEGRPPAPDGENQQARPGPVFKTNPEADALQKLLDDKGPTAEVKSLLEKYRAARREKEGALAAAQDNLRKVLGVRQEAQAVLLGLLP